MGDSIDRVLNDGAIGLQYFIQLGPHYEKVFGNDGGLSQSKITALYDEQRGMNVEGLAATAAGLQKMLDSADLQGERQRTVPGMLTSAWQGEAADAAVGVVTELATRAAADRASVKASIAAINSASALLLTAVQAKAALVRALLADGKNVYVADVKADEIDNIITGKAEGFLDRNIYKKLFGGEQESGYSSLTEQECDRWLREIFKPDYEAKIAIFRRITDSARLDVDSQYVLIEQALKALDTSAYPAAKGAPSPAPVDTGDSNKAKGDTSKGNGDQSGGGDTSTGGGGSATTAGTQSADTSSSTGSTKTTTQNTDTSTDDTSTDDSDTNTALSALTSAVSELGTTLSSTLTGDLGDTLTSAVESVGTSISDGIEQLTEQASGLLSGEHEASFQLGDTTVSIEAGENGLSLTTTDANGDSQQYRLTLDENGLPVIEQESSSVEASDDESNGVLGSGTAESGTGQGEAGLAEAGSRTEGATPTTAETPDLTNAPATSEIGNGEPSSGSVAGGVPVGPRASQQETDGEHTPSVEDHPVSNQGESGAVLAEAGPL
ncbi:hypothetical protein [Nocardia salmonicida]|uniref:hypothetical protein n=1 Tax=Nocardia salmonicida TaxID=53431 RepID=UPI0007A4A62F|nr:hypothetical protein [Nocardia salmonicida]